MRGHTTPLEYVENLISPYLVLSFLGYLLKFLASPPFCHLTLAG